jgi:hypothetical protein
MGKVIGMPKPQCPKCAEHDAETTRLVQALFSQDEAALLSMLTAASIHNRTIAMNQIPENDLKRVMVQRDVDFASQLLGKLMVSFTPEYRRGLMEKLRGVNINLFIQHAACPHKAQEGAPA